MNLRAIKSEKQLRDGWYIRVFLYSYFDYNDQFVMRPQISTVCLKGRTFKGPKSMPWTRRINSYTKYGPHESFVSDLLGHGRAALYRFSNKTLQFLESIKDPREFYFVIHPTATEKDFVEYVGNEEMQAWMDKQSELDRDREYEEYEYEDDHEVETL